MDLTFSRNGETGEVSVQGANGALNGAVPIAKSSGKRGASEDISDSSPDGQSSKEYRKQKEDKISCDLFEQIAVERSEIAFSEFYDRFSAKVYALLLRIVRTEEDALDLLQEVFI